MRDACGVDCKGTRIAQTAQNAFEALATKVLVARSVGAVGVARHECNNLY